MKKIITILSLMMIYSTMAFSQTPECSGEIVVPSLVCTTLNDPDIRLYMLEFQTCQNEKIVQLDRHILGMTVFSPNEIHTIMEEDITIAYAEKRSLIDPENRVDNLSFLLPRDVKIIDGETTIEMKVNYDKEFKASFKMTGSNGEVLEGPLDCSVNR